MTRCTTLILMSGLVLCASVFRVSDAVSDLSTDGLIDPATHQQINEGVDSPATLQAEESHARPKRTLFLKKKILGAGLLGFGLGVFKGYKAGYQHSGPEVHHVYVAPPPAVKYVEYVEKPVYVERIVERPIFKSPPPEYEQSWSPHDPSPAYGYD